MKNTKGINQANVVSKQLTREALTGALYLLLKTKRLEQVSVSELVVKAGVSRSAYYRNFTTIQDVFSLLVTEKAISIFSDIDFTTGMYESANWEPVFDRLWHHQPIIKILNDNHQISLLVESLNHIAIQPSSSLNEILRLRILNGGFVNLLSYWVTMANPISSREIADKFVLIITELLQPSSE